MKLATAGKSWRVATSLNVTSWGSGQVYVAQATAPILAVQEHKLTEAKMVEAAAKLARAGKKWIGSPANQTEAGGASVGVALVFSAHVDAWYPWNYPPVPEPAGGFACPPPSHRCDGLVQYLPEGLCGLGCGEY